MALGERVRLRRQEKKLTAAELASRAKVSKGYISEIESGQALRPSGTVLFNIATALGTTVADLLEKSEIRQGKAPIPESLRQFANEAGLPQGDIEMLAQIKFRGEQPQKAEDWRFLYESIKRSIGSGTQ